MELENKQTDESTVVGDCPFCGQTYFTKESDLWEHGWVDGKEAAAMTCTCGQAKVFQNRHYLKVETEENIEKLYSNYPELQQLMKDAAGLLINRKMDSIAIKLGTHTQLMMKRTPKDAIKVERKKAETASLES